jgi:NitT/TauT family transport system substrate-binding protein
MKHKQQPLHAALVTAAMLSAALICAPAKAQEGKVWRHGMIEPKSDAGIYLMAFRHGFAEKLGLKVEVVMVKDDQIGLKAAIAGELDSYEGGPGGAIVAAARGADVKIIGCHWVTVPHGIFVKNNINSLQDLKGKSIAVSAPNSMPDMLARGALAKYGIPVEQVKLAALGGDLDRYKALVGGVVEAAVVSGEYVPIAAKEGIKLLVPGREALPEFLRVCLHSTGKTLAERPDDAAKFLAAEMQGLRYAMSHKDEVVKLTQVTTGAKADDPRPAYIFDLAVETKAIAPDLPIPMERLSWLQDQLVAQGNMPKAGDLSKMVDTKTREKAAALAGK